MLKVDTIDNSPITDEVVDKIQKKIKNFKKGIVIYSDFRHGIFHKKSIPIFTKSINKNILKIADCQLASRWGNIIDYQKFDLLTPYEKEVRFAVKIQ